VTERKTPPPTNPTKTANELAPLAKLAEGQPPATRAASGRFLTGNNGGGRPTGSRNLLTETFLSAIADDFAADGKDAIARVRAADPAMYLKFVISLIPRQLVLQREREYDFSDMTIEEIESLIDRATFNQTMRRRLNALG
jgi:hypothetical protein